MKPSKPIAKQHNPASLRHFLREKLYYFMLFSALLVCLLLFLFALHTHAEVIVVTVVFFALFGTIVPVSEYLRRRTFYRKLLQNIASLDRAYLVLETLARPSFYDGAVLYEALYAINKSMTEVVQGYEIEADEFRDYIEMWIHEVKTPLATLNLMNKDRKIAAQLSRLDSCVEQVLYFARAENAEHDYLIKPTSLAEIIKNIATKNRDALLANDIDFDACDLDYEVFTDSKWLEFILGQILQNSIKYQSKTIKISATNDDQGTILRIADDGIGISAKDLPRVFEKTFTGQNGHNSQKSTGMGLYIAKTLCDKLGHQIAISSPSQDGTIVEITFPHHDYYTIMRPENHTPANLKHTPLIEKRTLALEKHNNASRKHDLSKK